MPAPSPFIFRLSATAAAFSLARLLRERHGFKGEIRAVGYLIPDLGQFLLRSGFDTAEIADPDRASTWQASLTRIKHNYQPGVRNLLPLRRDASRKEAERARTSVSPAIKSLGRPHREMRRRIEGRIVFSTSLQLEDQAILHAIAESGADIDIFTLDTGRLFPEVLETVELSELRYGVRIRLVTPDAGEVEAAGCPRRRVRLPPLGRQPQDLLRDSQSAAAEPRAARRARLDQRRLGASIPTSGPRCQLAAWDERAG